MQKRRLGRTDLSIAPLVLGGNVFGWTADEKTSFDLLDRFVDAGLNAIDTADAYSRWVPGNKGGESETIIGKWMKSRGNRDKIVVITKVGSDMGQGKKDLSAAYIEQAVEASLKRLQTDVDRPLSVALAGPDHALRGNARRLSEAARQGQDPLCRRLQPRRRPVARGARCRQPAQSCRATRCCSRNTISTTAPPSMVRCAICASPRRSASSPISASPRGF